MFDESYCAGMTLGPPEISIEGLNASNSKSRFFSQLLSAFDDEPYFALAADAFEHAPQLEGLAARHHFELAEEHRSLFGGTKQTLGRVDRRIDGKIGRPQVEGTARRRR